jgi:hypothetical protein
VHYGIVRYGTDPKNLSQTTIRLESTWDRSSAALCKISRKSLFHYPKRKTRTVIVLPRPFKLSKMCRHDRWTDVRGVATAAPLYILHFDAFWAFLQDHAR